MADYSRRRARSPLQTGIGIGCQPTGAAVSRAEATGFKVAEPQWVVKAVFISGQSKFRLFRVFQTYIQADRP